MPTPLMRHFKKILAEAPGGEGCAVASGSASDARRYSWVEENRTRGFDTLKAEIEHVESLGYELVPPEYKIPHWSEETRNGEPLPKLYVNTLEGVRPFTAALDRYAAELGYPLFFKLNVPDEPQARSKPKNSTS